VSGATSGRRVFNPTGSSTALAAGVRACPKPGGDPLVVEDLEDRLARLIPGAAVSLSPRDELGDPPPPGETYQVRDGAFGTGRVLGLGWTKREAIDRALFLYGPR
jgi:hypothetical protein